uniref:Bifunctional inhibitor/plant lipid transfer protein/seed storage helical domain-containing protein n=1 Tax=Oryza barthii TaxID=65489 RepID=A0A0D3HSW9_9ORYZ
MVSWRVAAAGGRLLILLVAQQASAQAAEKVISVSAVVQPNTKKKPPHQQPKIRKCTEAQKQDILHECRGYVTAGSHIILPDLHSACCDAARSVQNLDMVCIVDLLTSEERSRYNANRIKHLNEMCRPWSPRC